MLGCKCFPSITGPGLIGIDWERSAWISQTPVIKSKCGVALLKHKEEEEEGEQEAGSGGQAKEIKPYYFCGGRPRLFKIQRIIVFVQEDVISKQSIGETVAARRLRQILLIIS